MRPYIPFHVRIHMSNQTFDSTSKSVGNIIVQPRPDDGQLHPTHYIPSSIPTSLHQAPLGPLSDNISSASPTCFRGLTSISLTLTFPLSFNFMALLAMLRLRLLFASDPFKDEILLVFARLVNPWGAVVAFAAGPLMTGRCYCRGSEEEDRRFRWR